MNGFKTIFLYEIKEEYRRKAFWITCIFIAVFTFCDIFPSFYSKEALATPDFTIYQRLCIRVTGDMTPLYFLIIVILCSGRIYIDKALQASDIILALPISKIQYFWGKVAGIFTAFSIIGLFSMIIVLLSNYFFNPLKIDIRYIILYFLIDIEFIIAFAVIVSTTLTVITKSHKISTLICLAFFVFSALSSSNVFIIFNGMYRRLYVLLQNADDEIVNAGLQNIAIILFYMLVLVVMTHINIIKDKDRIL